MIIKNYKELCDILKVEPTTGYSKIKQLEWFEEYFTCRKEGHKFIITGILDKPVKPMKDNRGGSYNTYDYTENIEKLILDILAQNQNTGRVFLSKNRFFHALFMINSNYIDYNWNRTEELSRHLDISEDNIQEWLDTTGGVLERSLESALRNLRNQSLIIWSKEITLRKLEEVYGSEYLIEEKYEDKDGRCKTTYIKHKKYEEVTREANDWEKKFILKTERTIIESLNCESKQDIIKNGLWNDFKNKLDKTLKDAYDILYHYQSYKILSNPEHIQAKWLKENHLLNTSEREKERVIVNNSVMERLEGNAKSRNFNAIKELEDAEAIFYNTDKLDRRTNKGYIEDSVKLNSVLINKDAIAINKKPMEE